MRRAIPASLLSVISDIASTRESHASLDSLFTYAGAPGEPPEGSKKAKALAWLRLVNKDQSLNPIDVAGKLIETYMEEYVDPDHQWVQHKLQDRAKIAKVLADCELQYVKGGKVVGSLGAPSRSLEEFIRDRDINSIDQEFNRAIANLEASPREAVPQLATSSSRSARFISLTRGLRC